MTGSGNNVAFKVVGADAIRLLKHISDSITDVQKQPDDHESIDISRLKNLIFSVHTEFGQPCVKCIAEYVRDVEILSGLSETPQLQVGKPEFKILKNRMSKIFEIIGNRLNAGELPSVLETDLFCRNAELMTTYSEHQNHMHEGFLKLVGEFDNAVRRLDTGTCRQKFAAIQLMKIRCHHGVRRFHPDKTHDPITEE